MTLKRESSFHSNQPSRVSLCPSDNNSKEKKTATNTNDDYYQSPRTVHTREASRIKPRPMSPRRGISITETTPQAALKQRKTSNGCMNKQLLQELKQ